MRVTILCCLIVLCGCSGQAVKEAVLDDPDGGIVYSEYQLGDIPAGTKEIEVVIQVFNPGSELLRIEKVTGPCSCFAGWEGDKEIAAGQTGYVWAKFDKNKIPSGEVTREVDIFTNNPEFDKVKIDVKFNVIRSPEEEQLYLVYAELLNIKNELRTLKGQVAQLIKKSDTSKAKPKPKADTTVYDIDLEKSPVLGPADAPITIVQFTDFQCPYCIKEFPKIQKIIDEYKGNVRFVFKHYPLSFHKEARPVHAAAELVLQEKGNDAFWKMYDMIMANPRELGISTLRGYAGSLDLDMDRFDEVMADEKLITELLSNDKAEAKKCNVSSTPAVFINGLKLADRSIDGYQKRINSILKNSR